MSVVMVSGDCVDSPKVALSPSYAWISTVNAGRFLMSSEGWP
jgi:hypothetical protein